MDIMPQAFLVHALTFARASFKIHWNFLEYEHTRNSG
jgi:hypothetical protein